MGGQSRDNCAPESVRLTRPAPWLIAVIAGWLALVGTGTFALARYKEKPGASAHAPSTWPGSDIIRVTDRPTLVLFAHPMCPCTRATISELNRLVGRLDGRVTFYVLFLGLDDAPDDWSTSDLIVQAKAIPGVQVLVDHRGEEAARFGTRTSGQVLLYDTAGQLQFEGGITTARGHEGDSPGAGRILALVGGDTKGTASTAPVFGCGLNEENPERGAGGL